MKVLGRKYLIVADVVNDVSNYTSMRHCIRLIGSKTEKDILNKYCPSRSSVVYIQCKIKFHKSSFYEIVSFGRKQNFPDNNNNLFVCVYIIYFTELIYRNLSWPTAH